MILSFTWFSLKYWGLGTKDTVKKEIETAHKDMMFHESRKEYHEAMVAVQKKKLTRLTKYYSHCNQDASQ
jgi:hypothetical protein